MLNKQAGLVFSSFLLIAFGTLETFGTLKAQNHIIDSLKAVLKTQKDDTNKVNTLNALSEKLWRTSKYDSALVYANNALTLAAQLRFEKGKGFAFVNIGNCYLDQGNYSYALNSLQEGLSVFQSQRDPLGKIRWKKGLASCLTGIGTVYNFQGNYPKSLEYYYKALAIYQEMGYKNGIAALLGNIGGIYYYQQNYSKALEYYFQALDIDQKTGDREGEVADLGNIGSIYSNQGNYDTALKYDLKALDMEQKIGDRQGEAINLVNIGNIYTEQKKYARALEYQFQALVICKEIGDKRQYAYSLGNIGDVYAKQKKYALSKSYLDSALLLAKNIGEKGLIKWVYGSRAEIDSVTGDYKSAWANYKNSIIYSDSLINEAEIKKTTQSEMNYEFNRQTDSAKAVQDKLDAVALKEKQRQKVIRNSLMGGFTITFLAAGIFFMQRRRIAKEKKRSDELLLNILPAEVAEELKAKGSADAKDFDEVTVLFTDFKGFTKISEKLTAKELVAEIDYCFKGFDKIMEKYGIEKIKTIGDSYMAAGGLPVANKTHAKDAVNAALEIVRFMVAHKQQRIKEGKPVFEIRTGINTGPVVAGIVGIKKFAYDIWGDTVNLASRMESSGEPGKINISGSTYELVKNDFTCTHRGKIEAKNKGEVDMYFVE